MITTFAPSDSRDPRSAREGSSAQRSSSRHWPLPGKLGTLLALCLLATMAVSARAQEGDPCKVVIVSGNAEYPPLTWRDKQHPDRITGFAIELLALAFKDLGITVEARYVGPWARAQDMVRQGEVDMLAGAYITEERKTYMDYITPPFIMDPTVVFVKKGDKLRFNTWDDLIGLKGGTPIGNSYGEKFDAFEKEHLDIERVPKLSQAFDKLEAGRNRYVIYGLYPALAEAEVTGRRGRITYLTNSVISEGLYFTFGQKSPCNTPRIKAHLESKVREFTRKKLPEQLMEKYLKLWKEQSNL
jgi:polar amino acid transport system substrate-binding protein